MLLTIDLGNTNLTIGLYDVGTHHVASLPPAHHWRLATEDARMPDEYGLQFLGLLTHIGKTPADLHGICLQSHRPGLRQIPQM
jgi:type III pantothenate kinase